MALARIGEVAAVGTLLGWPVEIRGARLEMDRFKMPPRNFHGAASGPRNRDACQIRVNAVSWNENGNR
jgi:hypothetical protein